ncbi:putative MFS multidrug transporter [Polyplosphaeria fusca]|uniref:MFS multidrug transporter n=1 Tax=Polyplosphaeria fusca TaxID=682080 RepID=A0A9P4QVI0_9PLEO|nr:putative MFS multidrug transporter [Polyplosphaeria fusca]
MGVPEAAAGAQPAISKELGEDEKITQKETPSSTIKKESLDSPHAADPEAPPAPSTNIVDWSSATDPSKPINWSTRRKAKNMLIICYCTFLTPLASTMFAPSLPQITRTFSTTTTTSPLLSSFTVSIYILGYFFGPLFLAPLSELYGRYPVYLVCAVLFTIFNIACALAPSLAALIFFRFLAGAFGGCPITIGAGTMGDLISVGNRGKVVAVWSMGPLMGPIVGPIAGGYLGEAGGWRWICWALGMAAGVGAVGCAVAQEETYAPVLLERKAKKMRRDTGDEGWRTAVAGERGAKRVFGRAIVRPLRLLFLSPIVSILSVYQGVMYGYMYLLFTTFPLVFRDQYGFGMGTIGLTYLGMGFGSFLSMVTGGLAMDKLPRKLSVDGTHKPEHRLPPLIPAAFFIPVGLFWYGWSADQKTHWIVPILGTVMIGFGVNMLMMCIGTYFIDAHPLYEASASAALTAVRSLIGALVPLAGRSMYEAMGLGWGTSLLGFLSLAMAPLPWVFYRYGERIRTNPRYQLAM